MAESAFARCPKDRRCHGKCCPRHAHCNRHGKCKCDRGFTKCGKKCRNLKTDENNCGSCGHACKAGETCRNGHCKATTTQTCGNGVREGTEVCDGNDLGGETCASQGFASGTLLCAAGCKSFDTSGCLKSPGQACSSPAECDSGFCVDGVCCDTPCTENCKSCNQAATPPGTCANVPFGQDPRDDCAPGPMLQGTCNGAGLCM